MSLGYAGDTETVGFRTTTLASPPQTFREASEFEGVSSLLIDHPGNKFAGPSPNCMEPSLDELVRLFTPIGVAETAFPRTNIKVIQNSIPGSTIFKLLLALFKTFAQESQREDKDASLSKDELRAARNPFSKPTLTLDDHFVLWPA